MLFSVRKVKIMTKDPYIYYENIPEIIGIKTNVKDFFWGFGGCDSDTSEENFNKCKIKVFLEERADKRVFEDVDLNVYNSRFRHFRAAEGQSSVLFEQTVKRAVHLRYALTVDGNNVKMIVGKTYLRFVKAKLMYTHAVAFILFDVVSQLLLQSGMTTLYCSAVYLPGGKSAVFMAPPNTGKSLCALRLRKDAGAEIIAEDMAVTDGVRLWGAPNTNLYRDYNDSGLMKFDGQKFRSKIDSVDHIAILQKSDDRRTVSPDDISAEDFDEKLLLINRYSLGYYYSPCVRVLSYYNDGFSVRDAQNEEERLLKKLAEGAGCYILKNPDPMRFSDQIMSAIDREADN